jgi:hypothetical protein
MEVNDTLHEARQGPRVGQGESKNPPALWRGGGERRYRFWDNATGGPKHSSHCHVCCAIMMAKRDPASRYVWSTRRLNRTGTSIAAQYRTHAIEFLSRACKMNDSCRTSEVIDEALYWFNMAERGESQISANLADVAPPARRRGENR